MGAVLTWNCSILWEKMVWEYHQRMIDSIREEIEIYDRRIRIAQANKRDLAQQAE